MKKPISLQQYKDDFRQVVLFFTCSTIHEFFSDDPKKFYRAFSDYAKMRSDFLKDGTKVSAKENHRILANIIHINFGIGLPRKLVDRMFHTKDGKQSYGQIIDEMVANDEIKKIKHGVLPSKEKTHFMVKYLLPLPVLEEFFADKQLAKILLEQRVNYWTKRQNRFIGKELERRKQLKEFKEVLAVKKQEAKIEQEEDNMVHELLDEI